MKLEVKHLALYLPYKLDYFIDFEDGDTAVYKMIGIFEDSGEIYLDGYETTLESKNCKPILRPITDLTKEIEVNGEKFIPYKKLGWGNGTQVIPTILMGKINFYAAQQLLEWHFDIFGLIDKDFAVSIYDV